MLNERHEALQSAISIQQSAFQLSLPFLPSVSGPARLYSWPSPSGDSNGLRRAASARRRRRHASTGLSRARWLPLEPAADIRPARDTALRLTGVDHLRSHGAPWLAQ